MYIFSPDKLIRRCNRVLRRKSHAQAHWNAIFASYCPRPRQGVNRYYEGHSISVTTYLFTAIFVGAFVYKGREWTQAR